MAFRSRYTLIGAVIVVVVVAALSMAVYLQQPAPWLVQQTEGVDKYAAHQPVYGTQTNSQSFEVTSQSLSQIHILIVDFKHQVNHSPLTLKLYDEQGSAPLRTVEVDGYVIRDDYYVPFTFAPIEHTAGQRFTFVLSAPQATREAPYAVRRTADEGDQLSSNIAFSYYENKTIGYVWQQWMIKHHSKLQLLVTFLVGSSVLLVISPFVQTRKKIILFFSFVLIAATGLYVQWDVARQLNGDPGGDSYYYFNTAYQLTQGINPFVPSTFRLPFYSVTLMPALVSGVPDFLWGRIVGVLATILVGVGLWLLGKSLRLHPLVGVGAFAWLYFNTHYLVTSVRPRPYEFYAALLVCATALLWRVRTTWHMVLWGTLLGIMGLTRQESFVPIGLLVVSFLFMRWRARTSWRVLCQQVAAVVIPLVLFVSPYFYYNYVDYGNPFFNAYVGRDDTQTPQSLSGFWHGNMVQARDVLATSWLPSHQTTVKNNLGPILLALVVTGLALVWVRRQSWANRFGIADLVAVGLSIMALWFMISWLFFSGDAQTRYTNPLLVASIFIGIAETIRLARWRGALVFVIVATQLLITTLFQTQAQHFQQSMPFLALYMMLGLVALFGLPTADTTLKRWQVAIRLAPLILWLAFLGMGNYTHLGQYIDTLNFSSPSLTINMAAAERLHQFPGVVASELVSDPDQINYAFHSYFQDAFIEYSVVLSPRDEQAWLCQHAPQYVVDHEEVGLLTLPANPAFKQYFPVLFVESAQTQSGDKIHTTVYEFVNQAELCG